MGQYRIEKICRQLPIRVGEMDLTLVGVQKAPLDGVALMEVIFRKEF